MGGTDADHFEFNTQTLSLAFKDSPDFETKTDYALTFAVNDGTSITQHNVTVNILDENESPSVQLTQNLSIVENTPAETPVTTFSATDPENAQITYSLNGPDSDAFTISSDNKLFLKSAPNFEVKPYYDVSLRVSDGVNNVDKDIVITVNDVDEAPEFSSASDLSILEGFPTTTAFHKVMAADPEGVNVSYGFQGTDAALFTFDPSTGDLFFKEVTSFGPDNEFEVEITANDGSLSATQTLNIKILEEFPLRITSADSVTIVENSSADTIVYSTGISETDQAAVYSLSGDDC